MTNRNKAKGTRWEAALRDFFRDVGIQAYRPAQEGRGDVGDLHGLAPFVGQAKDWDDTLAGIRVGLDGVQTQAANAHQSFGVNFVKRRRAPVGRGYAVMTVTAWARMLLRLRSAESRLAALDFDSYEEHLEAHSFSHHLGA